MFIVSVSGNIRFEWGGDIRFEWGNLGTSRSCPVGRRLTAGISGPYYATITGRDRPGFHLFRSRRAAEEYCYYCYFGRVVRVRYKDAFAEGYQSGSRALVAGMIYPYSLQHTDTVIR